MQCRIASLLEVIRNLHGDDDKMCTANDVTSQPDQLDF